VGENNSLFITIDDLNEKRIEKKFAVYSQEISTFKDKTVAVLGLSFKKNTNDTRVAPALAVIPWLLCQGATVRATDPQAIEEAKILLPDSVIYTQTAYEAATGADVLILLVEWDDYTGLDFAKLQSVMKQNPVFIDTRNQYAPNQVEPFGFKYLGVGR
jgi:UDPglucose 6-dehydrogenase